jgi:hypothetical protein
VLEVYVEILRPPSEALRMTNARFFEGFDNNKTVTIRAQ